jgi:steroid Delta-isomerase
MNSDHAYIRQEWHRAASTRDTPALTQLYAEDSILESPLVPVIMEGKKDGVLSEGDTLIWEYPRATPEGDQVEIVEVMQIAGRWIRYHRIYWGWKGCLLIAPRLVSDLGG